MNFLTGDVCASGEASVHASVHAMDFACCDSLSEFPVPDLFGACAHRHKRARTSPCPRLLNDHDTNDALQEWPDRQHVVSPDTHDPVLVVTPARPRAYAMHVYEDVHGSTGSTDNRAGKLFFQNDTDSVDDPTADGASSCTHSFFRHFVRLADGANTTPLRTLHPSQFPTRLSMETLVRAIVVTGM